MRSNRVAFGIASFLSVMPLSEAYAACTYTPISGGARRVCTNGTCTSESIWQNNRLVSVVYVECVG
jgi:hypothetical protein